MGLRHIFGDRPVPRLLDFMRVHQFWDYPISEMANATGISYRALQSIVPQFVKQGLFIETRRVSNAKFYKINVDSLVVQKLDELAIEADTEFGLATRTKETVRAIVKR